jgi:hypothetical protein
VIKSPHDRRHPIKNENGGVVSHGDVADFAKFQQFVSRLDADSEIGFDRPRQGRGCGGPVLDDPDPGRIADQGRGAWGLVGAGGEGDGQPDKTATHGVPPARARDLQQYTPRHTAFKWMSTVDSRAGVSTPPPGSAEMRRERVAGCRPAIAIHREPSFTDGS